MSCNQVTIHVHQDGLSLPLLLSRAEETLLCFRCIRKEDKACTFSFIASLPDGKEEVYRLIEEVWNRKPQDPSFSVLVEKDLFHPDTPALDEETAVFDEIHHLIGCDEWKEFMDELRLVAPQIVQNQTYDVFLSQSFLFSINDGYGLSTFLRLFAKAVDVLGLFVFRDKNPVVEYTLPKPTKEDDGLFGLDSCVSWFQKPGRLICLDISEWMGNTEDREFKEFLSRVEDYVQNNLVVFRIPFVEKEVLGQIQRSLGDILFIREITFPPYTVDELLAYGEQSFARYGYKLEPKAKEVFCSRLYEERSDGRFYGMNTVRKVVNEALYLKHLSDAKGRKRKDPKRIRKEDILSLSQYYFQRTGDGFCALDELVGLGDVKKRIREIVAQIEATRNDPTLEPPCIHMQFTGGPGTGKTTVARILGQILRERGILRNGNFFEYNSLDLCGRYVGETAPKTAGICRDAYGSVLFIDEAYALFREDEKTSSFGREAIDTLISEMENHRTDLVVILAGYTDDMEKLMNANAGLKSRIPYRIEFSNYSREELLEIFLQMCRKRFPLGPGFEETAATYFLSLSDGLLEGKDFSNARFVRNLFERTWGKAAVRSQLNRERKLVLCKEDLLLAGTEREFENTVKKKNRSIGFLR